MGIKGHSALPVTIRSVQALDCLNGVQVLEKYWCVLLPCFQANWLTHLTCAPACNVVLPQKRTQLRTGADAAIDFHAANAEDTKGCQELLPPLFQAGGPYHTLGVAGFITLQDTLKNDTVQLKDFYKCLRELTRKK